MMPQALPPVERHSTAGSSFRRVKKTTEENTFRDENHKRSILVGQSPAMTHLFSVIDRIAPTDSSVLVTGATGTGKEMVSRAIHDRSPRRDFAFVGVNCSAIPETLVEAELFGHERGSFTGADQNRCGLFEVADRGTLLLDEIDALSLSAQTKLLRALQERSVRHLGGRVSIAINVRVISATNCDLAKEVAAGRFRADLYYRLRVLHLQVPELCKREGDIELLANYFLDRYAQRDNLKLRRFNAEAMRALVEYPWPGNVRELENAIEYATVIGQGEELTVNDLPSDVINQNGRHDRQVFVNVLDRFKSGEVPLAEIERRYILTVLERFGGNQVKTAAALGIDRSKLYRRLKQYGVMAVRFLQEDHEGIQWRSTPERTFQ
jgi:DNA-binding NtrC family response regulator